MVDHDAPAIFPEAGEMKEEFRAKFGAFGAFTDELNRESSRGCALLCCSYLDDMLEDILRAFFAEGQADVLLKGFHAPLGSFATRIRACYALGLLKKVEFEEIGRLKVIRNDFAHQVGMSFATQGIRDKCGNLVMSTRPATEIGARAAFTTSAVTVILRLTDRATEVARDRRVERQ